MTTTDAERSPRVDVLFVMRAFADQGLQVCCGLGQGGGMDENGNGEPPSCCGQPITSDDMRDALDVVTELLAADRDYDEAMSEQLRLLSFDSEYALSIVADLEQCRRRRAAALEAMSLNQEPRT